MEEIIRSISKLRTFATHGLLLAVAGIVAACSDGEETPAPAPAARLDMSLIQQRRGRAHFEDQGGTASFVWDTGNAMIAAVSDGTGLVPWQEGGYHSPMSISLIDPNNPDRVLRASSTNTLAKNAAAVGNPIYYLSPVNGSALCQTDEAADRVTVRFSLPETFEQSASGRLDEFEDYCFIHGESTVASVPEGTTNKNFTSDATRFYAVPAIFRFKVTNNTASDLTLESVKVSCDKLFPDHLAWTADKDGARIGETGDRSGYFNTIKTAIDPGHGDRIAAKDGETTATGTYYAMCLPYDDASSMAGATLGFILETPDKTHTFCVGADEFFGTATHKRFESNKIYTLNFEWNENSVELEGVTISDWVIDSLYYPTEEISLFVKVRPSYWVQDRKNLYTFSFIKMNGEGSLYTLWSKCNLGEYLNFAIDNKFTWNEVTPVDASDTDYLKDYFNGITDFKWQTPSRDDFDGLFSDDTRIKMCMEEGSGTYGLCIKSSVAGVKDSLFLPCTRKEETRTEFQETGITEINRTFHGYYWTRDVVDDDNAWLMHFKFRQTETTDTEGNTLSMHYEKAIEDGSGGYKYHEFVTEPKNHVYSVRAILQQNE